MSAGWFRMRCLSRAILVGYLLMAFTSADSDVVSNGTDLTCHAEGDTNCSSSNPNIETLCKDQHEKCEDYARHGECEANPLWMLRYCQQSCKMCSELVDLNMGVPQAIQATRASECRERLSEARAYVNHVRDHPQLKVVHAGCYNQHENCTRWAVNGQCWAKPDYMLRKCAPVCFSCEQLKVEMRCPVDLTAPNAWSPGDLDRLFEDLATSDEYRHYEPKVLSRPAYATEDDEEETADYTLGPWILVLENFLSQHEAERLIELGALEGYKRSFEVGRVHMNGTHEKLYNRRTSATAWCLDQCHNDTVARAVLDRIANLTRIPDENSEQLQLLKYEVGEKYDPHHDYLKHQINRQSGVRVMTVYLYLNDVEQGGGTNFPDLNLTVFPKRGRALLWPSVKNDDPNAMDPRTEHQALPVEKGVKYGANAWLHQRDFKTPHRNSCA